MWPRLLVWDALGGTLFASASQTESLGHTSPYGAFVVTALQLLRTKKPATFVAGFSSCGWGELYLRPAARRLVGSTTVVPPVALRGTYTCTIERVWFP